MQNAEITIKRVIKPANEWVIECVSRESRLNAVINSVNWNRTFKRCFKHFFAVKQRCQGWDNLFYLILELLPIQDKMIYGHNCDCLYKSQNIKKSLFTTFEQSGECVSRTTIKPANRVMSAECRYHDITQLLCFYLNKWLHKTHSTIKCILPGIITIRITQVYQMRCVNSFGMKMKQKMNVYKYRLERLKTQLQSRFTLC